MHGHPHINGFYGAILGFASYLVGHLLNLLPSVEEAIPALILAGGCALMGAIVTTVYRFIERKALAMIAKWSKKIPK